MKSENIKNVNKTINMSDFDLTDGDLYLIKGELRYYDNKQELTDYDGKYGFVGIKNYNNSNLVRTVDDHPLNALLFKTEEDAYLAAKEMGIYEPMLFQLKEIMVPTYVIVVELYLEDIPLTFASNIVWTYDRKETERKIGKPGYEAVAYWFNLDQYDAFIDKFNDVKSICLNTLYNFIVKTTKEQPYQKLNLEENLVV